MGTGTGTATGAETLAGEAGAAIPPVPTPGDPPRATTVASPSAALVPGEGIRVGTIVEVCPWPQARQGNDAEHDRQSEQRKDCDPRKSSPCF